MAELRHRHLYEPDVRHGWGTRPQGPPRRPPYPIGPRQAGVAPAAASPACRGGGPEKPASSRRPRRCRLRVGTTTMLHSWELGVDQLASDAQSAMRSAHDPRSSACSAGLPLEISRGPVLDQEGCGH